MRLVLLGLGAALLLLSVPKGATAHHTEACQSASTFRSFVGRSYDPGQQVLGVRADIDVGAWGLCTGATSWDFLYFFVDIGVAPANSGCQVSGSCLVQYGIYRSSTIGTQYAWAYGGCGTAKANVRLLGAATTAPHNFKIDRDAGGTFRFYLDGVQQSFSLSQTHASISCWALGDRGADWLMEKADYGNGMGETTQKSQFDTVGFRTTIGWGSLISSNPCIDGVGNDFCTDYDDGDFDGWSDNGNTLVGQDASDGDGSTESAEPGVVGVPWR